MNRRVCVGLIYGEMGGCWVDGWKYYLFPESCK